MKIQDQIDESIAVLRTQIEQSIVTTSWESGRFRLDTREGEVIFASFLRGSWSVCIGYKESSLLGEVITPSFLEEYFPQGTEAGDFLRLHSDFEGVERQLYALVSATLESGGSCELEREGRALCLRGVDGRVVLDICETGLSDHAPEHAALFSAMIVQGKPTYRMGCHVRAFELGGFIKFGTGWS